MTNAEAKGYLIIAAYNIGLDVDAIERLLQELHGQFDVLSEREAEERGAKLLRRLRDESSGRR